jgi:hypothetical protein
MPYFIFVVLHIIGFMGLLNVILDQVKFGGTAPLIPALWIFVAVPLTMIYFKITNKDE